MATRSLYIVTASGSGTPSGSSAAQASAHLVLELADGEEIHAVIVQVFDPVDKNFPMVSRDVRPYIHL